MKPMRAVAALSILFPFAACGGGGDQTPPPNNPPPRLPPSMVGAGLPSASSSSSANAAPPQSEEVDKGIALFKSGKFAEARTLFESAAKKNGKDFYALYNLGLACDQLGDKGCSENAYKNALAVRSDYEEASVNYAALLVEAGRFDEALAVSRAALAKHAQNASLHNDVALALAGKGDQEGAFQEFQKSVDLAPNEPSFHISFAQFLTATKQKGAAAHLDAAMQFAKGDVGVIMSIGHEYRMAGMFTECVQAFDKAIAIKDGGEARTDRALCKHGLKDDKAMLADLKTAVQKEPSYAPGHYYLGGAYGANKQFTEAAAEYEQYLKLEPNGSLAQAASRKLEMARQAAAGGGAKPKK
jgi:Flp pilus assembly protein TadD